MVQLNEDILEHSGGSWHAPPAAVEWAAGPRGARTRHPGRARGAPALGVQGPPHAADARWLAAARSGPRVRRGVQAPRAGGAIPRRSPEAAGRGPGRGVACPQRAAARAASPAARFPLVCFDDDSDVLARNFDRVAEMLGLAPATEEEPFFTDDLRRMDAEPVRAAAGRERALRGAARARALRSGAVLVSAIRVTQAIVRPFRRETVTSQVRRVSTWAHGPSPPSSAHGVGRPAVERAAHGAA